MVRITGPEAVEGTVWEQGMGNLKDGDTGMDMPSMAKIRNVTLRLRNQVEACFTLDGNGGGTGSKDDYGNGDSYGHGNGTGSGNGYGYGDGDGYGYGTGFGYDNGRGYGCGHGYGDGDGDSQ